MALREKLLFQSVDPSVDVPVLTSPSGWNPAEQAVFSVDVVLDDLFGLLVTLGALGVLEGR